RIVVNLFRGNDSFFAVKKSGLELTIDGAGGNDSIVCGAGSDSVTGGTGNDTIIGNAGNNTLNGGEGDDSLVGGVGDDSLVSPLGSDTLIGGDGSDIADFTDRTEGMHITLDGLSNDGQGTETGNVAP